MFSAGHILLLPGYRDPHDGIGRITSKNFSTTSGHVTLYQIITFRHFSHPEFINHSTAKHRTACRSPARSWSISGCNRVLSVSLRAAFTRSSLRRRDFTSNSSAGTHCVRVSATRKDTVACSGISTQLYCRYRRLRMPADQPAAYAGEFIDLLPDELGIIVISRHLSPRTGSADRGKPGLPAFRACLRLLSQQIFILPDRQ